MAKKFLTGLTLVNLPSDPSVGSEGELYFNTSASVAKIYKEGAWSELGAGGGAAITVSTTEPASPNIGDAWYKNDTGEFYVYDGTYWVEVNGTISLTQEQVQDYVAPLFTNATNTNVIATYDDANNVINLNTSGSLISVDSITYPDYITFDTTPEVIPTAPGSLYWDSGDGLPATVLNANVSIGIGQEQIALVKNATGSSIAKGKVVYISGAQGQRPTITLSDADTETTSSKTFGVTSEVIADGAEGFVTTFGVLRGINTDGLTEGGAIWLSQTAGNFTQTIPAEPAHTVFIGYVVKAHASSGEIFVNIQNGYELNELHGVLINGVSDNQALVYNSSASLWYNESIVNSLEGTANEIDVSASVGNIILSLPNDLIAPGDLTVTGNLTVSGSTTYINTQTLNVEDNIILLNSNVSGSPTGTAGIEIERGTEVNTYIVWDESTQTWRFSDDIQSYALRSENILELNVSASAGSSGEIDLMTNFAEININTDGTIDIRPGDISGLNMYKFTKTYLQFPDTTQQNTAFLGMTNYDTDDLDEGVTNLYFTNQRAIDALASTLSNYLTNSSASTIYQPLDSDLTAIAAISGSSGFLKTNGSGSWSVDSNTYLTTETDPVFSASDAASITSGSISNWNTAYGWGDHSTEGYLTTETDPVFSASDAAGIDATDISNWNTAYGWGNHASAGYALSSHNHTLDSLSNVVITGTPSDGQAIVWDTATSKWVNETVSGGGASYPDQTGNNGKFLQTNGASVSWQNVDFTGYLTEASASTIYLTQASASTTYLTAESDTLETVTDRGATSTNSISITNATAASSPTTGALTISGGVGIGEDLYVNNDVYIGGDINITGSISGSLTYVNVTDLVVTDPLIYLAESNPNDSVDIGIFAALNHSSSAYYHTGLIRDASDSGKWKLASNLLDPTNNVIDFTGATFDTLKIGALEVTDSSTTRTNLGLAIGTDIQAYNSTLAAVAGGTYTGDDSITTLGTISSGTWNGTTIGYAYGGTGLTSLGSAGYVLAVNGTATGLEWVEMTGGGGGSSFTNSSELAALLSDETGSGSAVFSNSPTFINSINGSASVGTFDAFSTSTDLVIGYQGSASNNLYIGYANHSSGATKTVRLGGNGQIGSFTNIYIGNNNDPDNSTNFLYGNTINDRSITSPIYYLDDFEGNSIKETVVNSASVATIATPLSGTTSLCQEFIIHCSTSTGSYSSKVLMLSRGTATPVITEYAILTQGTAPTVTITPSYSSSNATLTVTSSVSTSRIIIFEVNIS